MTEATPSQSPRRKRRPWWRWNLTTLAAVLFVMLWSRELFKWHYAATWTAALLVGGAWLLAPLPWVERERLRRMPPAVLRTRAMLNRSRAPWLLSIFRYVGLLVFVLAGLHFCLTAGWWLYAWANGDLPFNFGRRGGSRNWLVLSQAVSTISASILPMLGGAGLYVLAVLASRLWDTEALPPSNSPQADNSTRSIE